MTVLVDHLSARQILDSRGYPTIECTCHLTDGRYAVASVPSGASTGTHEAVELRDNDPEKYGGKSVEIAVHNINTTLSEAVMGQPPENLWELDEKLIAQDGTLNKEYLGANAILASSISIAKAGALIKGIPLFQHIAYLADNDQPLAIPLPMFNILNGGLHAGMNLDIQEFMLIPSAETFPQYPVQLEVISRVYYKLRELLKEAGHPTTVGDEGGFAPRLEANLEAINLLKDAVSKTGFRFGQDIRLSLDLAATTYYKDNHFHLKDFDQPLNTQAYQAYLTSIIDQFNPVSFEDPFPEDEWEEWSAFMSQHGAKLTVVGDDLLVTNPKRLQKAIEQSASNAILVKPNQIGTVTEAIQVVNQAKNHQFKSVASHRSGETTDSFIADFAVGTGTNMVKFGAPARGERVSKYNRLLKIYSLLKNED